MTGGTGRSALVGDAIAVDEIGIETGIFGPYRLRSSYQPIFARRGDVLFPVVVEGLIAPHRAGKPVSPERFFDPMGPEDRVLVEGICRTLSLRNRRNIGVEGLDLLLGYDPRADCDLERSLGEIRLMAGQLAEIGVDPRSVVVEINQAGALDPAGLRRLVAELRGIGVRIAIDGFATATQDGIDPVEPNIVSMTGARLRTLYDDPATRRLFNLLVSEFRDRGAQLLVKGVEDAALLQAALRTGADLLQGNYLAPPALVGTVFDETTVVIAEIPAASPNVLRFLRSSHQPR